MATTTSFPFQDSTLPIEARVDDLAARLTLYEKITQVLYDSVAVPRLGIPAYNWWNECLHGVARAGLATVFPQAIALAATFDTRLMGRVAEAISDEARAKHHVNAAAGDHDFYHGLTFWSPNINIFRDPRWGRGQETYGECPFLTGRMGVAFIKGLQGDDEHYLKVVATAKHYAVHSGPEGIRHEFDAVTSLKDLWETYLPAFYDCVVEAKVYSIMGAYNRTNGDPCCAHPLLMDDILRDQWGFEGYYVSDCGAIEDFHAHHKVTSSPEESAALAIKEGCDLNCGKIYEHLRRAVELGLASELDIDRCLKRLLKAKFKLGMFDPPEQVPYAAIPYDVVDSAEHRALALESSRAAVVLLKNENNLLPLSKEVGAIAVIGPNADNRDVLLGNYCGTPSHYATAIEGIRAKVSKSTKVLYAPGCDLYGIEGVAAGKVTREFAEAIHVARQADVVVLVMGLSPRLEGEQGDAMNADASGDRLRIELTGAQNALIAAIHATGKPIVLVVASGSAVSIPWAADHIPAIVQQFYSGQVGGNALADVLFGDYNPAGRMPLTVYRGLDDLPPFEDYSMVNRTYRYFEGTPLYPFGFGLSYTSFAYSDLTLAASPLKADEDLTLTATVANTGDRPGEEVVQAYLSRDDAPVRVPIRQLVAIDRITLAPGESKQVRLTIPARWFCVIDEDGKARFIPGMARISVGGSQPDARSIALGAPTPVTADVAMK